MSENPLYQIRPAQQEDLPFIFNSFLKSYRDSPTVAGVPNSLYYAEQHRLIERLIRDGVVYVACNLDDVRHIFGYVIGGVAPTPGPRVLHWVYVKHPFRGQGIARALVGHVVNSNEYVDVFYTHRVKQIERVAKERGYVYNPYLLNGAE